MPKLACEILVWVPSRDEPPMSLIHYGSHYNSVIHIN
jgi:hypothetical protein